jgi:chromosome segregation ATPase
MDWLKSKAVLLGIGCLALVGFQAYGMFSLRSSLEDRLGTIKSDFQTMHEDTESKMSMLESDLDVVNKRMHTTAQQLEEAQNLTESLKQQNSQLAKRLHGEISGKADSKAMLQFRDETSNRLDAAQKDASSRIDGVSGEVRLVRTDLDATREDLANSKRDFSTLIAHNSTELAELRRRGERDYLEFDIKKAKQYKHVGDILVQLKKTDVKRHKYEVSINVDDKAVLKKDRTVNEPIIFMVGRDRTRYEFVVNNVTKDRIRGYVSAPKDKLVASDTPTLRVQ